MPSNTDMLYKYRSLSNFRHFVDIVLKSRVHASPYFQLNDPMEGIYLYHEGELDQDMRRRLKDEKRKTKLCSFSKRDDIGLMWSHYAGGHEGVAIGVEVDSNRYTVKPIDYDGLHHLDRNSLHSGSVIDILTKKTKPWGYEEEVRAFVRGEDFISVEVCEIVVGTKMRREDKTLIEDLVDCLDSSIDVRDSQVAMDI